MERFIKKEEGRQLSLQYTNIRRQIREYEKEIRIKVKC